MGIYEAYYDCRLEPFSLSPDPRFLYLAEGHREALAQLRYAVDTRRGFVVLTGEVGTGKTTLLRTLLERVGPDVRTGYILNPPRSIPALYAAMAADLEVSLGDNPLLDLNEYLLKQFAAGNTVVVIFDEAQSLPPDVLEEIRLMTNLETATTKLMQIILAGQPEFDALLDSNEFRALRQRVALRHYLGPLSAGDTAEYIANRVRIAGAHVSPFTPAACQEVFRSSGGIPRLINLLCDHAMLAGYASESQVIDAKQIETVAADLKMGIVPQIQNGTQQPVVSEKPLAQVAPPEVEAHFLARNGVDQQTASAPIRDAAPAPPAPKSEIDRLEEVMRDLRLASLSRMLEDLQDQPRRRRLRPAAEPSEPRRARIRDAAARWPHTRLVAVACLLTLLVLSSIAAMPLLSRLQDGQGGIFERIELVVKDLRDRLGFAPDYHSLKPASDNSLIVARLGLPQSPGFASALARGLSR